MGLQQEWAVLRAHVDAILSMATPVTAAWSNALQPAFVNQAANMIVADAERVWVALDRFLARYQAELPPQAGALRGEWIQHHGIIVLQSADNVSAVHASVAWVCLLAGMKGNIDRFLADSEAERRSVVERAFEHLQRAIVVDPDLRQKWVAAHAVDEPACEKVGAVHLLWHGIWGFKAHATGERTDLVLGEIIDAATITRAERAGTALVLTEWKRVTPNKSLPDAVKEIEAQVQMYRRGSLVAVELQRTCYGVVVSEKRLPMPAETVLANYTLRFINVAVDPETPSAAARRS